jgi:hypothetical protein
MRPVIRRREIVKVNYMGTGGGGRGELALATTSMLAIRDNMSKAWFSRKLFL